MYERMTRYVTKIGVSCVKKKRKSKLLKIRYIYNNCSLISNILVGVTTDNNTSTESRLLDYLDEMLINDPAPLQAKRKTKKDRKRKKKKTLR